MLLIILLFILNSVLAIDYCTLCENGLHTMCRFKEGPAGSCINYTKLSLTPAEKAYIVDIHNDIRNHVASGQESRGALGNQPPAADMFLLEWDEQLAAIAQRWVDQCVSANATLHDKCRRTENFEVGQNVVTAITPNPVLPELSVLVLNWYKQVMSVIPSDVDEFTGIWRGKNQIGQYTQLVWAKTRFVGCAVAAFKENVYDTEYNVRFVCNYGPAGNVIGQSVYRRGKPCSECPYKACDRVHPNLCGDIHKYVNIKKKNTILKKYKDKASTLSNLIDIKVPKINTKLLNFSVLSTSETLNTVNIANTTEIINFTSAKLYTTDIINVTSSNNNVNFTEIFLSKSSSFSTLELNHSDISPSTFTIIPKEEILNSNSLVTEDDNYINTSTKWTQFNFTTSMPFDNKTDYYLNKSTFSDTSTDVSIYEYLNNLTNKTSTTKWSDNYGKDLKFKIIFAASVKLVMDSFLNDSIISEIMKKSVAEDKFIVDFTKHECKKRVKLDNGVTLVQDCEGDWRYLTNPNKKFGSRSHRRGKKIFVKGNDVILPGNRHFKRATGIWHDGHCRCIQFLRSCSASPSVIHFLLLVISFIHFVTT